MHSAKPRIILIGGGGHCKSCIDVIESEDRFKIAGLVDFPDKYGKKVLGYKVLANDKELPEIVNVDTNFLVTVGQIKTPEKRIRLYQKLLELKAEIPIVISPVAYVSKHATIGAGTIIMHGAIVNAGAVIGNNCIINSMALVEHDVLIENHCHISTGAILNGGVTIKKNTFIGSNSHIQQSVNIGENSVIDGGQRIKHDIKPNSLIK